AIISPIGRSETFCVGMASLRHPSGAKSPLGKCPPQKMYPSLMRPPSPSDNHDAAHRGLMFSQREILQEADAYGRWPERLFGMVPEFQDPVKNVAVRDCSS